MSKTDKIFIVGSSRSGTTMMSRVLANHSSVFSFKELHFFSQIFANRKKNSLNYNESVNVLSRLFATQEQGIFNDHVSKDLLEKSKSLLNENNQYNYFSLFDLFLNSILKDNNKSVACEQTPNNNYYLEEILTNYPEAKVINMIRDSRDVLLSQKKKWKRKFLGAKEIPILESVRSYLLYHPITTTFFWKSSLLETRKYEGNNNVLVVKFEDFLLSPKKKCKEICDFLDLDFKENMLLVPNIGSSTQEDSNDKLFIDSEKISKWKDGGLNSAEIFLSQFISSEMMSFYGYQKKKFLFPPIFVLFYLLSFPIKFILSFFFNLKRISSVIDLLKNKT